MSDLIERDEVIRALRLEYPMMPFFKELREEWAIKTEGYIEAEKIIMTAPTVDAVEVVRCRECMFSEVYQNDSSGVMGRFCEAFTQVRMVTDDDFCSYGERRE